MVNGGYGFAHLSSGQVILVRHVLPGEAVIVTIVETKKNYLFGKVEQILEAARGRRTPPCDYYGQCGGCDLQHCDYPTQLDIKREIVQDILYHQNSEVLRDSAQLLADPLPSPQPFGYRQRIRLHVGPLGEVGFHRFHSHDIIGIDSCPLAGDGINRALSALRELDDGRKLCELSKEVELQLNPQSDQVVCLFNYSRKTRPADVASAKRFCRETKNIDRVFFTGTDFPITGPYGSSGTKNSDPMDSRFSIHYPALAGTGKSLDLSWEAGGFCQVNLEQNRQLIETVLSFCRVEKAETILDLYCGMGNFAIPLAGMAKSVLGIEGQGAAIRCAKLNAAMAGLSNTGFLKSPIGGACINLVEKGKVFDCVILDPPRQGAPGLAAHLAKITTKRLVYISCDPATLCRDLAGLTDNGFRISRIQPIDMFPQSHHIETVVLLEK